MFLNLGQINHWLALYRSQAESDFSSFFRMPAALVENSQVICEVWASNLEEEMRKIREIVLSYSYIAMVKGSILLYLTHFWYGFRKYLIRDFEISDHTKVMAY